MISKHHEQEKFDVAREMIRIESDALARRWGLDRERVRRVMERTALTAYGGPLPEPDDGVDPLDQGLIFSPSLDVALQFLAPERALELFEEADLEDLGQRISFVDYLSSSFTPLNTVDEVEEILRLFAFHLEANRDHIIRTGYPTSEFARCEWLDWNLGHLYPVKLPIRRHCMASDDGSVRFSYEWPLHRARSLGFPPAPPGIEIVGAGPSFRYVADGTALADDGAVVTSVVYEEAALIEGVTPTTAVRLENSREQLLDLKTAILRELAIACKTKDETRLWENCLKLLAERLGADDSEFYLSADRLFDDLDVGINPGGLSSLLYVIGYIRKEIDLRIVDRVRRSLGDLVYLDSGGCSSLRFQHYYEAVDGPEQPAIDRACNILQKLHQKEETFWTDYREEIFSALDERLPVDINIKVPKGEAALFAPSIRGIFAEMRTRYERTGETPHLGVGFTALETKGNMFRCEVDYFKVRYEGIEILLKNDVGTRYIHYLLSHPGTDFAASGLRNLVQGTQPPDQTDYTNMGKEQLAEEGLEYHDSYAEQEIMDPEYVDHVRKLLKNAKEEKAKAETRGDKSEVEKANKKVKFYKQTLGQGVGKGGRRRVFSTQSEKDRMSISKAIHGTYDRIRKSHPSLHEHLKASIHLGWEIGYNPQKAVPWKL